MTKNTIVVGMGFGDEGKGTMTEYLARKNRAVATIRFNGGQQAAHNIVRPDGTHHTFSQFGSATLEGIPSYLSKFCTTNPFSLIEEALRLKDITGNNPYESFSISENALVTTPLHIMVNHEREAARGKDKHGSVGVGFGETISYSLSHPDEAIRVKDLHRPVELMNKVEQYFKNLSSDGYLSTVNDTDLKDIRDALVEVGSPIFAVTDDIISEVIASGNIVFEGAQGILLDQDYGFHPHTTWSSVVPVNAIELLENAGETEWETVGIIRSYHTRHGAGPFPTEGMFENAPTEVHNGHSEHQGGWRVGAFDLPLFRYASEILQPDYLAVTFADIDTPVMDGEDLVIPSQKDAAGRLEELERLGRHVASAERTRLQGVPSRGLPEFLHQVSGAKGLMISTGSSLEDKTVVV